MKRSLPFILAVAIVLCLSCKPDGDKTLYLGVPVTDIDSELQSLMRSFFPRIIDTVHGGYWTNFEFDWTRSPDQDKMLVTQARGLWTASRAASVFTSDAVYRKAADHGFKFLTEEMWDRQNGGFCQYYFTDSVVHTDPSYKLIYGNSFALYALSEYARINPDPEVIKWVKKTFDWLEQYAHDPVQGGYFNLVLPGHPVPPVDSASSRLVRKVKWSGADQKDQNTSIHLLEALTATYISYPDTLVRKRLEEMLHLVRDTMADPGGYLHLYFSRNWKAVDHRDSSRNYILKNILSDHISFGHNIETAYLIEDASKVLYGRCDEKTLAVSRKLIGHTLANGFDKDFQGIFDKGYGFKNEPGITIVDSTKTWWAQAEAWHALALFASLDKENDTYPAAFKKMWEYIENNLIDHEHGGWYNNGIDISAANKADRKAHAWKSCYHDGRALFQVLSYARAR